jgi:antitoxin (DNA-binding transcriptional repressor) of toxin-antitoxin stability system
VIVNLSQAKTQFLQLLQRVAKGKEITIATDERVPIARLVPVKMPPLKRELGVDKGKVWISEDFDAPSPDIEALFSGEKSVP